MSQPRYANNPYARTRSRTLVASPVAHDRIDLVASDQPELLRIVRAGVSQGWIMVRSCKRTDGIWHATMVRIPPDHEQARRSYTPRWRRPVVALASVTVAVTVVMGLVWWVTASVTAALAGNGAVILGALALTVVAILLLTPARRRVVEVIVRIYD